MDDPVSTKQGRVEDMLKDEAVKLAMQLIDVESLSGHEQPMAVVLKGWLETRGWVVRLQEVEPQKSTVDGSIRHNLYACRPGVASARAGGPRVLFNSHIDTVRVVSRVAFVWVHVESFRQLVVDGLGGAVSVSMHLWRSSSRRATPGITALQLEDIQRACSV